MEKNTTSVPFFESEGFVCFCFLFVLHFDCCVTRRRSLRHSSSLFCRTQSASTFCPMTNLYNPQSSPWAPWGIFLLVLRLTLLNELKLYFSELPAPWYQRPIPDAGSPHGPSVCVVAVGSVLGYMGAAFTSGPWCGKHAVSLKISRRLQ